VKTCSKCGGSFTWRKKGEKWIPWGTGAPHWIECKAKQKRPLEIRPGKIDVGKDYKPSCEQCSEPPWEECGCSFGVERLNEEADARLTHLLAEE
jgi:hypothetical protein